MKRKEFIQSLSLIPFALYSTKLNDLEKLASTFKITPKMPVLFVGHGSPMNAIEENEFVQQFRKLGTQLPTPNAILCISAHWETNGTFVTAMQHPKTIHDFGGFTQALFDVEYNALGSPELAKETQRLITTTDVKSDLNWGLDHGCWSILKTMYPKADIPVIQLSLDQTKGAEYHYNLARQLSDLRTKGILIIGSGNMVHNLGMLDWQNPNNGYDWAIEANVKMKSFISSNKHLDLMNYTNQGESFQLAIPSPEHYLPLLYSLALKNEKDNVTFFNDKTVMGSISMTSLIIGS